MVELAGKHSSSIWNLVPLCLMWCIWRECNRQTFEDLDWSEDQLLALFSGSFFDWARAWGLTTSDSIPLFLSSLLLCIYWLFCLCFFFFFVILFCWCYFASSSFLIYFFLPIKKKINKSENWITWRLQYV